MELKVKKNTNSYDYWDILKHVWTWGNITSGHRTESFRAVSNERIRPIRMDYGMLNILAKTLYNELSINYEVLIFFISSVKVTVFFFIFELDISIIRTICFFLKIVNKILTRNSSYSCWFCLDE